MTIICVVSESNFSHDVGSYGSLCWEGCVKWGCMKWPQMTVQSKESDTIRLKHTFIFYLI